MAMSSFFSQGVETVTVVPPVTTWVPGRVGH